MNIRTASTLICAAALLIVSVQSSAQTTGCTPDWSALAPGPEQGVDHEVRTLAVFDDGTGPALYAGGFFATAAGVTVNGIARWDGAEWTPLVAPGGVGVDLDRVYAMRVHDDGSGPALFVAGDFTAAGGVTVNSIGKWNGADWQPLTGPSGTGVDLFINAIEVYDDGSGPALFVGGRFFSAGGQDINYIAKWDGTDFSPLLGTSGTGLNNQVRALTVHDDGTGPALYAAGFFTLADGQTVNRVARWDGADWSPLTGFTGTGTDAPVYALAVYDDGSGPALYAGGFFTTAGGLASSAIARWNGSDWTPLIGTGGAGITGQGIAGLHVHDDGSGEQLYAGGLFSSADSQTANSIAKWNGTDWSVLSSANNTGVDNFINTMIGFDEGGSPSLVVGGFFQTAGDIDASNLARWGCDTTTTPCPADVTGDGEINLADLNLVLANFGQATSDGDTNDDNQVDLADLNAVLAAFGTSCA